MTTAAEDFRAALLAHAPLVGLVGQGVAMHAVPANQALPYVVFSGAAEVEQVLDGAADERTTFTVDCWATTAESAAAVAAAVRGAVVAFDDASTTTSATVLSQQGGYDAELGLDGVVLTVEWWP